MYTQDHPKSRILCRCLIAAPNSGYSAFFSVSELPTTSDNNKSSQWLNLSSKRLDVSQVSQPSHSASQSTRYVTQVSQSVNLVCHSSQPVSQLGLSLKSASQSTWSVTQISQSVNLVCHSSQQVSRLGLSLKSASQSTWSVTQVSKSVD
jgi:DNA-binding transcriptional regulator YdaS (Cro superfamily)